MIKISEIEGEMKTKKIDPLIAILIIKGPHFLDFPDFSTFLRNDLYLNNHCKVMIGVSGIFTSEL